MKYLRLFLALAVSLLLSVGAAFSQDTPQQTKPDGTLATITISGQVLVGHTGLAGVTISGLPGNPVTDASGNYSVVCPAFYSGTATPSKAGYTFSPASTSYVRESASLITSYTATILTYTISGAVMDASQSPISGVSMNGLKGSPVTNSSGVYTASMDYGQSFTVTPSKAGYTFNPPSMPYTNLLANQTQNFQGTIQSFSISGDVKTSTGAAIPGVVMSGLSGNPTTDATGHYATTVNYGTSWTVTPALAGYTFSPANKVHNYVTSNISQDYVATQLTYAVSGTVKTSAGVAISGVTMSGLTGSPVTDASGFYTATVNWGFTGPVTPTLAGYAFSPSSTTYANGVQSNQTTNYTGTIQKFVISGYTRFSDRSALSAVTMSGLPTSPTTNSNGYYSDTVTYGWSGTVTPTKAGYTFDPVSTTYSNVSAPPQGTSYEASVQTIAISGFVRDGNNRSISYVVMSGLPNSPTTNSDGYYTSTVSYGWSGTVTPSKSGYAFTPASVSYSNVTSSQTGNYTGTLTYTISGSVKTPGGAAIAGVTINGLPGNPVTTVNGTYSATVNSGWSGTATPSLSGYVFSPTSKDFSNVTSNQTCDFTGAQNYSISGTVTRGGMGLGGVVMSGLTGNPSTNPYGSYYATVTAGWSGTVTPTLSGYRFLPTATIYTSVASDQSTNYTAYRQFTISGTVKSSSGAVLTGVTMSGLGNTVTDGNGSYSAVVDSGWSGTVTPIYTGYDFSPVSMTYSGITGNQSKDYTGTLKTYTISGTVKTSAQVAIPGVVLSGLTGNPSTDASGAYSASVSYGWTGTVTPTKSGYTFSPASTDYRSVSSSQSTSYVGTLQTFTVSGYVRTAAGAGISGVSLSGFPGSPATDTSGFYSAAVSYGWSGTVTPAKTGYTFSPSNSTYSNLTSSQSTNYTGSLATCTISGTVKTSAGAGIAGVVLSGLTGNPSTDALGAYSATVSYGWQGTVTPTLSGYSFNPVSTTYNGMTASQVTHYVGTSLSYTISGSVRTSAGASITGVVLSGLPGNPSTDANGAYSASITYGWSGTVTPTKPGYSFDPASKSYNGVNSSQTTNYTGTLSTYTISGTITTSGRTGISGVVLNGLPGNPTTDTSGYYRATVDYGWFGTVTPLKSGYGFSPSSTTYSSVAANQNSNYTGTPLSCKISGTIRTSAQTGISGVLLSGLPGNPTTDTSGAYSVVVTYGWSGTVTPAKTGYSFSPVSSTYGNVTTDQVTNYTATLLTYAISGAIRTAAQSGVSGVVLSGLPGDPATDATGAYSVKVNYGWSGTVTPVKAGYSFSPVSSNYLNVISDQVTNYAATFLTNAISGTVRTAAGAGISGVVLNGLPGNPATDATGAYTVTVDYGWSGTVTPAKSGYTFSPPSTSYTNITTSQTGNFTGTLLMYSISGSVRTATGAAISGVLLSGLPGNPTTDVTGHYAATVDYGWSGSVVPSKSGYVFAPSSTPYSNVTGNQAADYVGAPSAYNISGYIRTAANVGIAGVVLNGLEGTPSTNSDGFYSGGVSFGWSGTVTPAKPGYTFTPPSVTHSNVTADQSQNYTGTTIGYTVSGYVRTTANAGVSGVTINGLPGNPITNLDGYYSAPIDYGWSGTVTPVKPGYTFDPPSTAYASVSGNQATNYTATFAKILVSGYVRTAARTGVSGVVMNGLPGSPSTNGNGFYTATLDYGWSGTVTPVIAGYSINPPSSVYSGVTADQSTDYTATALTFTISGYVRTAAGAGISGVVMNGLPGSPGTSADGFYAGTVDYGWSGTVTPAKSGYAISPSTTSYTNVTSSRSTDYVGIVLTTSVAGYVRTSSGSGIGGVLMSGLPGSPSTDANGYYSVSVDYGWSGTVTPAKAGHVFSQPSTTYSNVISNQSTNYVGTPLTYTITGSVRMVGGGGLGGVLISGLPVSVTTTADGNYTATVDYGWSGTVTPTKAGYEFSPPSNTYTNVTSNQANDYISWLQAYTISGYVRTASGLGVGGVVMNGLIGNPSTDSTGFYSTFVNYGWSGVVTPTKTGYTFNPLSSTYSSVAASQTTNYAASLLTFTISGFVRTSAGVRINGVVMTGLPGDPATDTSGAYTATVTYGWSGTTKPLKAGYTFDPTSTSHTNVTTDQRKDYVGKLIQNPVPTLAGIIPTSGVRGKRVSVVLAGTEFIAGITSVGFGAEVTADSVIVINPTQLSAMLSVSAAAAAGARDVTVTNSPPGGGTATLSAAFTVTNPAPSVASVVPAAAGRGSVLIVKVTGSNFISGITTVSYGTDITVSNLLVKSPTELQASVTISSSAAVGLRAVTITNAAPGGGSSSLPNAFNVTTSPATGIVANGVLPDQYLLQEAYPNPFNPSTRVGFGLPEDSRITLDVHNMLGNVVAELVIGQRAKGLYELQWHADNLPSGVYLIRMHAESLESTKRFIASRKVVLVK